MKKKEINFADYSATGTDAAICVDYYARKDSAGKPMHLQFVVVLRDNREAIIRLPYTDSITAKRTALNEEYIKNHLICGVRFQDLKFYKASYYDPEIQTYNTKYWGTATDYEIIENQQSIPIENEI